MEIVLATLWIYRVAFRRTVELLTANLPVIFAPLAYSIILSLATTLFGPIWLVGGIIITAVTAACASSALFLIENIVRMGKVSVSDFTKGFSIYLWEILGIAFILWIPMMLLSGVAASTPQGPVIILFVELLLYVILNPVPELIYQTRTSGVALLSASYEFIVENWIEWFLPNVAIGIAAYWLLVWLDVPASYLPTFFRFFLLYSVFGLLLTFLMIFRGLLFSELNGTTRRSRAYRYRARAG
ncbi:MAG TPA: hypothetical protein VL754_09560 [Verrucomicrobiae bacterium]|jgi:hypothetical protein|nr:hypothetical protein [Verrucomicrobiae bacterium]